jgi:ELWxxDGT repeat protein
MRKAWIFAFAAVALMGTTPPGRAQGPVLVRDIATGPTYSPGSYASPPVRFRGEDYFGADDGFLGYELWATNGTQRGTRLVADLCPGRCPGNPWVLTPSGDHLFFIAGNTTGGSDSYWLWRSDGTLGGTFPLADLEIGGFGSAGPVSFLAPFRGGVVFIVHDRVRRAWSLWGSDGTRAGTHPIAPLPGRFSPADAPTSFFDWPRVQDDPRRHYFVWRGRPWATDGTAAGTGPVATPIQACGGGSARLGHLVVYVGEDEARDCEPWVSDGTARGTRQLRDIREGSSYPGPFVAAGGLIYFTAFDDRDHLQLWKTNGTPRGTVLVRALGTRGLGKVTIVGTIGSRIYFAADDGEHGVELWRSDGSPASTALVADLSPGAADTLFTSDGGRRLGEQMIFVAAQSGASVYALFQTRGTAGSTSFLSDYSLNGGPALAVAGNRLYFAGTFGDLERELGVTDGTVAGTHILDLSRPVASSNPQQLTSGPAGVVFLLDNGSSGTRLWRSGGHAEDTEPLAGLEPGLESSSGMRIAPGSGGIFYYTYSEERFGWTDGQASHDLLPQHALSFPASFVDLGNRTLIFAARPVSETDWQPWIWSSDGTPDGTSPVAAAADDTGPFYSFRIRAELVPEAGEARFLVQNDLSFPLTMSQLSATDGTAAGTRELVPIPIGRYQVLDQMVGAGGSVFASFRSDSRASLWASDGTAEGTREVYAIPQPYGLSFLSGLTAAGTQAFFLGDDFERGRELWASDGTPEGTHRVADLAPGVASSTPTDLAAFGDRVLFSANDGPHGRELWVSDGTEEGTHLLEIQPGPRGSYPQAFRVIGDRVVFAADDGVHGLEPWVTDGTPEGTRLAADVMAGPRSSSPRDFAVYGGDLFFNAGRPGEGYELWKLPLEALEQ